MTADQELVRRIVAGEQAAIEEFDARFRPRLIMIAKKNGVAWPDCEDVGQTAIVTVLDQLQRNLFRGEELNAWLYAIVRGKVADHLRSHRRMSSQISDGVVLDMLPARSSSPDLDFMVQEVLNGLPELPRKLLRWRYIEGQSSKEIARETGLRVSQVDKGVFTAKQMFKEQFLRRNERQSTTLKKEASDE